MKIIRVDNYDREGPGFDDVLVCENVNPRWAARIVDSLNTGGQRGGDDYFRLVEDDHKLQEFKP